MTPPLHLAARVSTNWTIFTKLGNNIIPLLVIPVPNSMISDQQEYQHDGWTNLFGGINTYQHKIYSLDMMNGNNSSENMKL